MKKLIGLVLAVCMVCGLMAGCENSSNKENRDLPKFERLGAVCSDGAEVDYRMDRTSVIKALGKNYDTVGDMDSYSSRSLEIIYDESRKVTKIFAYGDSNCQSTLGVAKHDSLASVKDKLGEPHSIWVKPEDSTTKTLTYYFVYDEGRYVLFGGSSDDWYKIIAKAEDKKHYVDVSFGTREDKVDYFIIEETL